MIVRYFHVRRAVIGPYKTHAIFVIYPYSVLSFSIIFKRVQFIIRRYLKIAKLDGSIHHSKFSARDTHDVCRETLRAVAVEYLLRSRIFETPDHRYLALPNVSLTDTFRNRTYHEPTRKLNACFRAIFKEFQFSCYGFCRLVRQPLTLFQRPSRSPLPDRSRPLRPSRSARSRRCAFVRFRHG